MCKNYTVDGETSISQHRIVKSKLRNKTPQNKQNPKAINIQKKKKVKKYLSYY